MSSTLVATCAREDAPGLPAHERALARLRAAVARDQRVAFATRRIRGELCQSEHYTDACGVRLEVCAMTGDQAWALLARLRANAWRLYRGELGAYLLRRYPHPSCQWVLDEYLRHVAAMTPSEWIESRPLYRALAQRASRSRRLAKGGS